MPYKNGPVAFIAQSIDELEIVGRFAAPVLFIGEIICHVAMESKSANERSIYVQGADQILQEALQSYVDGLNANDKIVKVEFY